jgi:hypothetical protein
LFLLNEKNKYFVEGDFFFFLYISSNRFENGKRGRNLLAGASFVNRLVGTSGIGVPRANEWFSIAAVEDKSHVNRTSPP